MSVFILIANRLQLDRKRETGASIIFKVAADYPAFLRFRQRQQMPKNSSLWLAKINHA
jgi:hypothetical protein